MRNICVIPARGGSKRLPGKNIKPFLGEPIIMRPIKAAHQSGLFDRVVVSTDDEEIGRTVRGFALPEWRNPELCKDDVPDIEVVRDLAARHRDMDYLCYLYPTAALVTVEQIRRGLDAIHNAAVPKVYCRGPFGDAGQFSWYNLRRDLGATLYEESTGAWVVPAITIPLEWNECQDINTAEDFELAEMKAGWA